MNLSWDTVIVGVIVGAALVWVLWRGIRRVRPGARAECDGCKCASPADSPVVQLDVDPEER